MSWHDLPQWQVMMACFSPTTVSYLRAQLTQIDGTLGATLGTYQGANRLGITPTTSPDPWPLMDSLT